MAYKLPSAVRYKECAEPTATATTLLLDPKGSKWSCVVPSPNWPDPFKPHARSSALGTLQSTGTLRFSPSALLSTTW